MINGVNLSKNLKNILLQGEYASDENLFNCVEQLYLGSEGNYILSFHNNRYEVFEKVFDRIIQKYGIRNVEFIYEISEDDTRIKISQI